MTVDLDKLEALARAATPGPWTADVDQFSEEDGRVACVTDKHVELLATIGIDNQSHPRDSQEMRDATFIAAVSPDVVLALIAELRKERRNAVMQSTLVYLCDRQAARIRELEAPAKPDRPLPCVACGGAESMCNCDCGNNYCGCDCHRWALALAIAESKS